MRLYNNSFGMLGRYDASINVRSQYWLVYRSDFIYERPHNITLAYNEFWIRSANELFTISVCILGKFVPVYNLPYFFYFIIKFWNILIDFLDISNEDHLPILLIKIVLLQWRNLWKSTQRRNTSKSFKRNRNATSSSRQVESTQRQRFGWK